MYHLLVFDFSKMSYKSLKLFHFFWDTLYFYSFFMNLIIKQVSLHCKIWVFAGVSKKTKIRFEEKNRELSSLHTKYEYCCLKIVKILKLCAVFLG